MRAGICVRDQLDNNNATKDYSSQRKSLLLINCTAAIWSEPQQLQQSLSLPQRAIWQENICSKSDVESQYFLHHPEQLNKLCASPEEKKKIKKCSTNSAMAFWHVDYCLDDKVPQHRSSFASPTPPDVYLGKSPWPKSSITTHSLSTARQGFFLDVDVAIQHMASCHSPVSDKFRGLRSGSCFKLILLIYEAKNGMFATVHDIRNPLATSVPESLQNPHSRQHRNDVLHTTPF